MRVAGASAAAVTEDAHEGVIDSLTDRNPVLLGGSFDRAVVG